MEFGINKWPQVRPDILTDPEDENLVHSISTTSNFVQEYIRHLLEGNVIYHFQVELLTI